MNLKSLVAAAAMAVLGVNAHATNFTCEGSLNGSAVQCGPSFNAAGAFSSSITFGNSTGASAWLTNGAQSFQYQLTSHGTMFGLTLDQFALGGTLPSGNWSVLVNGASGGYQGGVSYDLPANSVPAPVPEPETYAMMLLGLGALSVMGRRRKAK